MAPSAHAAVDQPVPVTPGWRGWLLAERQREIPLVLAIQRLRNPFLDFYFFVISELCEELFYIVFMPFTSWIYGRAYTVDITMFIPLCIAGGNLLKNIFQIPRPYHVDMYFPNGKQKQDHGLPSTHTMAQFAIPFYSFYYFYVERAADIPTYALGFFPMLALLTLWSVSVMASRVYLAYHNPMDVAVGLVLGAAILFSYINFVRYWIYAWILTPGASVLFSLIAVGMSFVIFHPRTEPVTPAHAESGLCLGTGFGLLTAYWVNSNLALRSMAPSVLFPIMEMFGPMARSFLFFHFLRLLLGFSLVVVARSGSKLVVKRLITHFGQQKSPLAEALGKFFCYFCISFTVVTISRFALAALGLTLDSDLRSLSWSG